MSSLFMVDKIDFKKISYGSDDLYGLKQDSTITFSVYGKYRFITEKDFSYLQSGYIQIGDIEVIVPADVDVDTGDTVIINDIDYKVIKVTTHGYGLFNYKQIICRGETP